MEAGRCTPPPPTHPPPPSSWAAQTKLPVVPQLFAGPAPPLPTLPLQGIEQRIDWTVDATAAAERAKGEAARALDAERKSIRTTIELQARDSGLACLR